MTTWTKDRQEAAKAREKAATVAPWFHEGGRMVRCHYTVMARTTDDARFIVAARNDMADQLAEIDRAWAEIFRLHEENKLFRAHATAIVEEGDEQPHTNAAELLRQAGTVVNRLRRTGSARPPWEGPRSCVAVIVTNAADEVLLVRSKKRGGWELPGGGMEPGETPQEAAEREAFEETGVKVKTEPLFSVRKWTVAQGAAYDSIIYIVRARGEGQPTAGSDAVDARWFARDAIPWADCSPLESLAALLEWAATATGIDAEVDRLAIALGDELNFRSSWQWTNAKRVLRPFVEAMRQALLDRRAEFALEQRDRRAAEDKLRAIQGAHVSETAEQAEPASARRRRCGLASCFVHDGETCAVGTMPDRLAECPHWMARPAMSRATARDIAMALAADGDLEQQIDTVLRIASAPATAEQASMRHAFEATDAAATRANIILCRQCQARPAQFGGWCSECDEAGRAVAAVRP